VEARDQVELFKQLAAMDEVFGNLQAEAIIDGKHVTSDDVSFVVRTDKDGNDYHELRCNSGPLEWYKRRYGQHKNGKTLFPRTQPAEGEVAGLRGWSKFVKDASRHSVAQDF
jgi:hypothetical protein